MRKTTLSLVIPGTELVKTGQTKQMYGYNAEEYKKKDSRGKEVFCWYARTGFNTQLIKSMGKDVGAPTLNDPDLLLVEAAAADEHSTARSTFIVTRSITDKQYNFSTKGYRVMN